MDFSKVVTQRRAVNFFDPNKDVPDTLLRQVINMAALTPSSFNLQPWQLIALRDEKDKLRLQKLAMNQPKVSEAPVTLIVLADRSGYKDENPFVERAFHEMIKAGSVTESSRAWFSKARGSLYGKSMESEMAFACKNTGFFAMALMLAAKSLGLDTHPMDGFDHDGVKKEFNIPDRYWIPLLIAVGYFDESKDLAAPKWRKTADEILVRFDEL
ncbi:nitroreductase family protein [uncultured Desulfobacter sp.]|uniref:nitroreductase family protein n=1 Tax=uncultured Desulfobacter sp. TaxID=240139 RepID=UPI002AAB529D|nr:nitroreductase family protein [uncultured Desulfobacter sp.]